MPEFLNVIGNFLYHVSPALVGVLLGGWLLQRYWVRKANESALIEYITKELSDLVDETLDYWCLDCSGGTGVEERRRTASNLASRIKAGQHNLSVVLGAYAKKYCKQIDFAPLMLEVHDACTGGEFEGGKRPPDPKRFLRVVSTTHRVRWTLLERRV